MQSESSSSEVQYRELFENPDESVITLSHLFDALKESGLELEIKGILEQDTPINVVIEGSVFPRNMEVVNQVIFPRHNTQDKIILADVSEKAVSQHQEHAEASDIQKAKIIQADMNDLPIETHSVDVLVNDCAINFNSDTDQNKRTLQEIHRVLRNNQSVALVTVVVARKYDSTEYGSDQELLPDDQVDVPSVFQSFRTLPNGEVELIPGTERKSWAVPYYEKLFTEEGFNFEKFDTDNGKTFFPEESGISYRRYLLKKV